MFWGILVNFVGGLFLNYLLRNMKKIYCLLAGLGVVASAAASQPADTRSHENSQSANSGVVLSGTQTGSEPLVPEARAEASARKSEAKRS